MKQSIFFLLFAVWFVPRSHGQKLTIKRNAHGEHTVEYSSGHPRPERTPYYFCGETKAGIGIAAGGIIIGGAGIGIYNAYSGKNDLNTNNDHYRQLGIGMWVVGGIIGIAGSVLAVDGSIWDYHRFCRQEYFSVISNKPNEVGLAFNFK